VAILLAGLYSDDCTRIIEWVAEANPEVAAQCILRSGAGLPFDALVRITKPWVPRLTDTKRDPQPEARAAIGRALGLIAPINGFIRDTRQGVGLTNGQLPDIDWVTIPASEFIYQDEKKRRRLPAFQIARYPTTYLQFQAFINARDGFYDPRWWKGLSASEDDKRQPGEQWFKYWNHPRETVSWYDAVAFCRWLSAKLGYEVTLPTEQQWERAARFTDSREYPWGNGYKEGFANINETSTNVGKHDLGMTSAVGIYPQGASPDGVLDLSGNVWEWCLNEVEHPSKTQFEGDATRGLRGGSWNDSHDNARAAFRLRNNPNLRDYIFGFRVVRPL
jgi:formylglycine-generating enzyme required for sulfatase activity